MGRGASDQVIIGRGSGAQNSECWVCASGGQGLGWQTCEGVVTWADGRESTRVRGPWVGQGHQGHPGTGRSISAWMGTHQ